MSSAPKTFSSSDCCHKHHGDHHGLVLLDRVGFCASSLCAIHCILMPLLIILIPVIGSSIFASERAEIIFMLFTVSLASLTLWFGAKRHGHREHLALVPLALLLFVTAHLVSSTGHWIMTAIGGTLLAVAHVTNLRHARNHNGHPSHSRTAV